RNSVKATVDAYDGTVTYYIADPDDPVASTYAKAFPGLLRPLAQMPGDLQAHIRYPEDLFAVQARMYAIYHMQDPQVFYNKEDLVYGPRNIDARINQDPVISQQISLWNQQGSRVLRGSLFAIPIDQSLIYIMPLYLAAEQGGALPELRRVVVVYGNSIAMEP